MHNLPVADALHAALNEIFTLLPENSMVKWSIDLSNNKVSFALQAEQSSAHEKMHLLGSIEDQDLNARFHAWMDIAPHFNSIPTCAALETQRSFSFIKQALAKNAPARARFLFSVPEIDTATNTDNFIGLQCATPTHNELKLALRVFSLPMGPLVHWRSKLGNNTMDFCAGEDPDTARLIEKLHRSTRQFLTHPTQQTSPKKTPVLERIINRSDQDIPTPAFLLS